MTQAFLKAFDPAVFDLKLAERNSVKCLKILCKQFNKAKQLEKLFLLLIYLY